MAFCLSWHPTIDIALDLIPLPRAHLIYSDSNVFLKTPSTHDTQLIEAMPHKASIRLRLGCRKLAQIDRWHAAREASYTVMRYGSSGEEERLEHCIGQLAILGCPR